MRLVPIIMLALAALPAPAQAAAQESGIAAPAQNVRGEIERILDADNLDGTRLTPREVVERMSAIQRGGAPEDFWNAYQLHLRAWEHMATLAEQVGQTQLESAFGEGMEELAAAETAVNETFAQVEDIARRYGARLPAPPMDLNSIA